MASAATLTIGDGTIQTYVLDLPDLPTSPNNLDARAVTQTRSGGRFSLVLQDGIYLTWDENDSDEGVTEYRVYRGEGFGDDFERIGTTEDASLIDKDVERGETYVYYVTALNDAGESIPSDQADVRVPSDCNAVGARHGDDCPEKGTNGVENEGSNAVEPTAAPAKATPTAVPTKSATPKPVPTRSPARTPTPVANNTAVPASSATLEVVETEEPAGTSTPEVEPVGPSEPEATETPPE